MRDLYLKWLRRSVECTGQRRGRKLQVCLMFIMLMTTTSHSYAQAAKLTINRQNATVSQIIGDIEKQSNLTFAYSVSALNSLGHVTLKVTDASLQEVMNACLKGSNYTYTVENNVVVIKQQPASPSRVITGRVVVKGTKQPVDGAKVLIVGTTISAMTDSNGAYRIAARTADPTLEFTFLGMKKAYAKAGDRTTVNVEMEKEVKQVGDVTVIAYGTRAKKELVSSVSSVKAADIDDLPTASLETLLQGQMAGVEVNNVSGSPGGGGSAVRVRGYNSLIDDASGSSSGSGKGYANVRDGAPLYVIDGVPVNSFTSPVTGTNTLAEIDPATIASVEVLKDAASAALYGSRASNGVILITTKQGQSGKATFSVNASYTHSILPKTPQQVIGHGERLWRLEEGRAMIRGFYKAATGDVFNQSYADSYRSAYTGSQGGTYDYFWNDGKTTMNYERFRPLMDSINPFYNNASNFWKKAFQPGKIWNANVSASGGSENARYMIGAGFYDEEGIQPGSGFSRYNLLSNLNSAPAKNLKIDTRIYVAYTERNTGKANGSLSTAQRVQSLTVNPASASSLEPATGSIVENLLDELNSGSTKNTSLRMRASLYGVYSFLPELQLSSLIATDYTYSYMQSFEPESFSYSTGSRSAGSMMSVNIFTNENILSYRKSFNDIHNFDVMAGYTYTREANNTMSGYGTKGPSDYVHYVDDTWPMMYQSGTTWEASRNYLSGFAESKMTSFLARMSYNFNKRYLVEATWRRDGSSTFGENNRWADFPSVAVGWNFSDESFMRKLWWLNFGKARLSWGSTGQTFADPYLAQGVWTSGESFLGNVGMKPSAPLNQNLKWERSDQYDVGLDLEMFESRIRLKTDYYYKYSSSILNKVPSPGNVYYHTSSWQNVMEISNEGIEIEATFDILRKSAVTWRLKFNISRNWNTLEKTETGTDMTRGNSSYLVIGRPIFGLYVLKSKGMVQTEADIPTYWTQQYTKRRLTESTSLPYMPGMRLYEDFDMNGRITDTDKYWAVSTLPTAYGGIVSELTWKNFDLNILFSYSLGRNIINNYVHSSLTFAPMGPQALYVDTNKATFWEKAGDNTDYPSKAVSMASFNYLNQFPAVSDADIEKVSFLRLKQLTIGYKLPQKWVKAVGLSSARAFFTGENLFLLHNYSGLDPEVVELSSGYDNFTNYPLARKMTIGLTLNF